jgi:hypothetical protein
MRKITIYFFLVFIILGMNRATAQSSYKEQIEVLNAKKDKINQQEKEALKQEVAAINERLDQKQISLEEADRLKESAAKKRALNIENRIAIIDNTIALLERNEGIGLNSENEITFDESGDVIRIRWGDREPWTLFKNHHRESVFDRRTYSDFVFAIGLNNALIDGQSIEDSPYKFGGSRFAEFGWQWRTRIFQNTNFLRLNYGFSFQFNGLKPEDNQYFVANGTQTELEDFEFPLKKAKLRMDNLVFPVHIELGPSKFRETEKTIRYLLHNQFRIGFGGYAGFNLGTRQKLKYDRNGENVKDKLKRGYNTTDLVYGLSGYLGFDGVLLYAKYDLSPLFKDAIIEQHNISIGLRFDL